MLIYRIQSRKPSDLTAQIGLIVSKNQTVHSPFYYWSKKLVVPYIDTALKKILCTVLFDFMSSIYSHSRQHMIKVLRADSYPYSYCHFLTQSLVSNFHFLCILIKRLLQATFSRPPSLNRGLYSEERSGLWPGSPCPLGDQPSEIFEPASQPKTLTTKEYL